MKLHSTSLVWLIVVLQAAKVYYIPETSTPPPMSMMQATAYNPVQGDIYYFSGRNDENNNLDLFAAFNVRSKRWRYIEPSNDAHPGKRHTEFRYTQAGAFDAVKQIFYVFGGESDKSQLNDLWSFDLSTNKVRTRQWSEVKCLGKVPPEIKTFGHVSYRDQTGDLKLVVGYGFGSDDYVLGLYE
jgi:hypothetical protein